MFGSNSLWFFQGLPSTSLRCWVTKTLTSSSSTGWSITWEAATRWEGDTRTTRSYDWCECGVMWVLFQYWTELLMVLLAVWLSAWLVPLCVQLMNMKECVPSCDSASCVSDWVWYSVEAGLHRSGHPCPQLCCVLQCQDCLQKVRTISCSESNFLFLVLILFGSGSRSACDALISITPNWALNKVTSGLTQGSRWCGTVRDGAWLFKTFKSFFSHQGFYMPAAAVCLSGSVVCLMFF